jgi:hypothetical protein
MRTFTPTGDFFLILAAVSVVALMLHLAFLLPRLRGEDGRSKPSDTIQTVIGAMFALSMTFLANATWATDDRAREAVNAEARSIRLMEIYAAPLDPALNQHLDGLLADYAEAAAREWKDMVDGLASEEAEQELKEVYEFVLGGLPAGGFTPLVQQRLLVTLDGLSAARQQRLSIAQESVRGWQWFLVIGLALILLVSVAAVHAAVPAARARGLAITVAAITIMFFVVLTYQQPFGGSASLTPAPIIEAAKALR